MSAGLIFVVSLLSNLLPVSTTTNIAATATNNDVSSNLIDAVARYFEFRGPLLVVCPGAPPREVVRRLKGQTVAAYDSFDPEAILESHAAAAAASEGEGRGLAFNSFLLCGHKLPAETAVEALTWAQGHLRGSKHRWVATCTGGGDGGGRGGGGVSSSCSSLATPESLHVGERVFLLDVDATWKVMEPYTAGGVTRTTVVVNRANVSGSTLEREQAEAPNKRRSDLHGAELRVMVEDSYNRLVLVDDSFLLLASSPSAAGDDEEVLEVPGEAVAGSYLDVLAHLAEDLNFTARLLKRKDSRWGSLETREDGTRAWTGMISSLLSGRADLIAAPFTNSHYRCGQNATGIDFCISPEIWEILNR